MARQDSVGTVCAMRAEEFDSTNASDNQKTRFEPDVHL